MNSALWVSLFVASAASFATLVPSTASSGLEKEISRVSVALSNASSPLKESLESLKKQAEGVLAEMKTAEKEPGWADACKTVKCGELVSKAFELVQKMDRELPHPEGNKVETTTGITSGTTAGTTTAGTTIGTPSSTVAPK